MRPGSTTSAYVGDDEAKSFAFLGLFALKFPLKMELATKKEVMYNGRIMI